MQRLRDDEDLVKPPGVAETLDWARALHGSAAAELDLETAAITLGAVVKYREDAQRVRAALDRMLGVMTAPLSAHRPVHEPIEVLLGFARALRAAGVRGHDGPHRRPSSQRPPASGSTTERATYWAGRATLCSTPDDFERYDQVFTSWFLGDDMPGGACTPSHEPPAHPGRPRRRWRRRCAEQRATTCCAGGPATPRCCGTATSPS